MIDLSDADGCRKERVRLTKQEVKPISRQQIN